MNNTPTPRTDAAYTRRPNEGAWDFKVRQEITMESLERELAAVTKERDRLADAIRKHKFCDVELYEALQSLNKNKP